MEAVLSLPIWTTWYLQENAWLDLHCHSKCHVDYWVMHWSIHPVQLSYTVPVNMNGLMAQTVLWVFHLHYDSMYAFILHLRSAYSIVEPTHCVGYRCMQRNTTRTVTVPPALSVSGRVKSPMLHQCIEWQSDGVTQMERYCGYGYIVQYEPSGWELDGVTQRYYSM